MEKWDIETLEPKKSGETVEDVIEFVRCQMYKDTVKMISPDDEYESDGTLDALTKILKMIKMLQLLAKLVYQIIGAIWVQLRL